MLNYWGTEFRCGDIINVKKDFGWGVQTITGELVSVSYKINKHREVKVLFEIKGYYKNLHGDGRVQKRITFNKEDVDSITHASLTNPTMK